MIYAGNLLQKQEREIERYRQPDERTRFGLSYRAAVALGMIAFCVPLGVVMALIWWVCR